MREERESVDAIDRVLAGLGRVEPGAGMEARVLVALECGRQEPAIVSRWMEVRWRRAAVALVCVAGVGLAIHPRHRSTRAGQPPMHAAQTGPARAVATLPEPGSTAGSAAFARVRRSGAVGDSSLSRRSVQKPGAVAGLERAAAEAVSFPAPPMPLTRQERLLLRMLRRGEATELVATLSPGAERTAQAANDSRFAEFFHRAPIAADPKWTREPAGPDKGLEAPAGPTSVTGK